MRSLISTITSTLAREVVSMARLPSISPKRSASAVLTRSAPSESFFRHVLSRKIVLAVKLRRSPAERTSGYSGSPAGGASVRRAFQLAEPLGDAEVDAPVRSGDPAPRLLVVVDAERQAARARKDRVEQRLARLEAVTVEAGTLHAFGEVEGAAVGGSPQDRGTGSAVGQRRAERAIEHHGRHGTDGGVGRRRREEGLGERGAAECCRGPKGRELGIGERPHGFDETGMDLRLGQGARQRVEDWTTEAEHVLREVEVEERRLELLVLRLREKDLVGEPSGLGHRDIDDDEKLE